MRRTRFALFQSMIALLLCFSMLVGTTFAWFTDGVSSGNNTIAAGSLDIEMEYLDAAGNWQKVTESTEVLDRNALWEPGHTEVAYLKITNAGSLALKYALGIQINGEKGSVNAAGEAFKLSDHILFGVVETEKTEDFVTYGNRADAIKALTESKLISQGHTTQYSMKNKGDTRYVTLVVYMPSDVGNAANYATGQEAPEIQLGIQLVATQEVHESDSFGSDYDAKAEVPGFTFPESTFGENASADVKNENNQVAEKVDIQGDNTNASIPAGVKLEEGVEKLTLEVSTLENSEANINLGKNDELRSLNVHVEGVAADNTVPMEIHLKEATAKGLNAGNLKLYHVENGVTVEMELVGLTDAFTAHNQFKYDPATGDITLYMATFSEVALVADKVNAWNGEYDYDWYDASKFELTIVNADQLAGFGAIVGGMSEMGQDDFAGKTVKLLSNINLGDKNDASTNLFYPIGYYNEAKSYTKQDSSTAANVSSFSGTFDGQGHTIANFYQNTWQMWGNYDGNNYKVAMGLFGYINGGTVKNLTVSNFSSDGEYTPTGVIAAYADGDSTFENISIFNCNPRVYNTGNGGIIGIAGSASAADDDHITLKNITVDNSNKISALWGSYDVACGGLVGMYRGNVDESGNATGDTIYFENCHVAAQMDVYNDVCGNYQYYAYRYAGMIIGSVRHNTTTTTEDGSTKTIPNMKGISAEDCTVNYGDWNDYYYCEFISNGHPSYSGENDYKFSRVPNSEIDDSKGKENATCIGHNHDKVIEDNQAVYLPFHQLFTGYGWGVNSVGLETYGGITVEGKTDIDVSVGDKKESVVKFESKLTADSEITKSTEIKVGDLFSAIEGAEINASAVQVAVSALNDSGITAEYAADTSNWENGTLTFNSVTGLCSVTIQDYEFCKPTTVILKDGKLYDVFVKKFTGNFLYRVGNQNEISLGTLFAENGIEINDSSVNVEIIYDGYDYNANSAEWQKRTVKFSGTGVATIKIKDETYCNVTELKVEVINAVNATGAISATSNNVVLLNDCGFSSLEVSGGYTLYGNGFTMTCGSDSAALDMGYSFVTLNNGTLDNVQIVCPNYDYAALYKSNLTSSENRSETTDRTRYYNAKSGVMASGNSQILNSRISGGRASLNVSGGNVEVENSHIELGAVASILVGSANSLTLRDVTLIQKPAASTHDSSKTLMGFSVLYLCDSEGNATPTTLEGSFVQQAWIDEDDAQYVPSAGKDIVTAVLKETDYLHDIDGDGTNESLNLGFAYMPEDVSNTVAKPTNITDKRTDKATIPYEMKDVSVKLSILSTTVYVYSYKNTDGTADNFKTESEYEPNKYSDIITVTYSDTIDGLTTGKSYGTDGWVYELNVDLDKASGYTLDFSKLSMTVNGVTVTDYMVNGNTKPTSPVAVTAGGTTYILTATIDGKEYTATYKVTGTETSKESPSLVGTPSYGAGFGVANKYGGDWSAAAPVLDGITIKYWSVADSEYKEFALSSITFANTGKQNGTNNYWEYTHTNNDFTLKLTNTAVIHSSSGTYGMPVAGKDGKLYFTISSSGGFVSTGTTSRSITIAYEFTDNNGGDTLKFSHTWSIPYSKDEQYNYSSFTSDGTLTPLTSNSGSSSTCITPDTLITLANGKQVRVDSLTGTEELLVWNLETGKYDTAPIVFVDTEEEMEYEIIHLYFSDGSDVKVIYEHGFFDLDLGKYVYIDAENYAEYVGHRFVTEGNVTANKWNVVTLDKVVLEKEVTTAWSPVTSQHLCYYTNGVLSMPGGIEGLFNIFEVNTDTMRYDAKQKQADIETYGLFTLEDFGGMITEEAFQAFNGAYLKVAMGKGLLTWEDIAYMAERYIPLM